MDGGLTAHWLLGALAVAIPLALLILMLRRQWRIHGHLSVARLGGRRDRAPRDYVSALFDGYADHYDQHLLVELNYAVPNLISAEVGELLGDDPAPLPAVLDLGCGTGLLGVLLRSRVEYLTGVDLSREMLRVAQRRGVYDALHQGDLIDFLQRDRGSYALITAADVLVYMGALEALFERIAKRLDEGGRLIFTTEALSTDNEDNDDNEFVLQPTGRFAHAPAYVARVAAQAGLRIERQRHCQLRQQRDQPVSGHLYRFARAARSSSAEAKFPLNKVSPKRAIET